MTGRKQPEQPVRCTCGDDPWRHTAFPGYALPPFDPEALAASRLTPTPVPAAAPRRKMTGDAVWSTALGAISVACLLACLLTFPLWRKSS
ncbi:hypothetical protein [Streptomyces sp. NPDC002758]